VPADSELRPEHGTAARWAGLSAAFVTERPDPVAPDVGVSALISPVRPTVPHWA